MTERRRIFFKWLRRILKVIVTAIWIVFSVLILLFAVLCAMLGPDPFAGVLWLVVTIICVGINYLLSEHKRNIQQHVRFLLEDGLAVIVNIYANERLTALSSNKVKSALQKYHVVVLEEDITKYHDELMEFIRAHDRNSAPFTIVYGPNARDGIILSEKFSEEEVVVAIEKATTSD